MGETGICLHENTHKFGRFHRTSDGRWLQRYRCKSCKKTFSQATHDPACWQRKRDVNHPCMMMLASNMSMRRAAIMLTVNRKTVARKLDYLAAQLRLKLADQHPLYKGIDAIQFDELQTIEHTKWGLSRNDKFPK